MPGIVGLVTEMPREWAEKQVQSMLQTLCHESFYERGTWRDEQAGVYLGWAARKDSFSSKMPVHNERESVTLIFSGEEFPEPGTKQRLKEKGHDFDAAGLSYIAHIYEDDPSFPASLNGRFQGIVIDQKSKTATLFNDRYGMHRVYIHEAKEAFYFAAEAKAILEVRPELRRIHPQALGEFVSCGCVLENRTLFDGIDVLPPASAWVFQNRALQRKGKYFQPKEWESQERLEPEAYYREIRDVFASNLNRYFAGEERVGLSLTGGLDSRMILAWHQAPANTLPCYTFGGPFRECQDVVVSREVARACHQSYEVIPLGEKFLSNFAHYAERSVYLADGCVRVNRSADLYLNEMARQIAPVRMTGNYGSEVLRWVPAFKPSRTAPGLFSQEFLPFIQSATGTYNQVLQGHPVSFAVFRQAPWHHHGLLALEQTQLSIRTPYLDNDLVRTVFRAPEATLSKDPMNSDVCIRLICDGNQALGSIRTDRGLNGDGAGISAFALRQFLEFTFKAEYAYDVGMPQRVAQVDHSLSWLHLERLFLGWHKFSHFRVWYRDSLAEYVRQILLDPIALARPYLQRNQMEAILHGHLKGNRNHTNEIHLLLTLELMQRLFVDSR